MTIFTSRDNRGKSITRREFLGRSLTLAAASALPTSLYSTGALASMPKRGGTLRIGAEGSTTDVLDPLSLFGSSSEMLTTYSAYNHLFEIDEFGQPKPELVESWETRDATNWMFKLRKGVEFHNGKTLSVDDVIASLNRHRGEDSKSVARNLMGNIRDIKKDGPHTLKIILKTPNVDLPSHLSLPYFAILNASEGKFYPNSGVGTGGYIVTAHKPGISIEFKRNQNYWKSDRAHFSEVEILILNDTSALSTALITGEVDAIDRLDFKYIYSLERDKNIEIVETPSAKHFTFPMLTNVPPFDNSHIRTALKYAIDREAVLKNVMHGYGSLGNDHPISPAYSTYDPDIPQRQYDPDKVRYNLNKAGVKSLEVPLYVSNAAFAGAEEIAAMFKGQAKKSGIRINVDRVPADGYWSDTWMRKPWVASAWSGRLTANDMFSAAYAEDSAWNETNWKNGRFNQLLAIAKAELNAERIQELHSEMQMLIHEEGGTIIPIFQNNVFATGGKLSTNTIASNYNLDGFKIAERWWFNGGLPFACKKCKEGCRCKNSCTCAKSCCKKKK